MSGKVLKVSFWRSAHGKFSHTNSYLDMQAVTLLPVQKTVKQINKNPESVESE